MINCEPVVGQFIIMDYRVIVLAERQQGGKKGGRSASAMNIINSEYHTHTNVHTHTHSIEGESTFLWRGKEFK